LQIQCIATVDTSSPAIAERPRCRVD